MTSDSRSQVRLPWIPAAPRRRGHAAGPDADRAPSAGQEEPRISGLVFLILVGDERLDDHAAWRRGRSVLRAVSQTIATAPGVAYQVRALQSSHGAGKSKLQRAGRLPRRHMRRSAGGMDIAQALGVVRVMLKRDQTALELSGVPMARPTIVFFAVDPPLADAVTAQEYGELAREASITWVVPERRARLMSAVFAAGDARILTDHRNVTAEVAHHLRRSRPRPDIGQNTLCDHCVSTV